MLNGQEVVQIGHTLNEKSFKFLGIHIDETLKHVLPKSTLFTLYSALVHSHINYGLLI